MLSFYQLQFSVAMLPVFILCNLFSLSFSSYFLSFTEIYYSYCTVPPLRRLLPHLPVSFLSFSRLSSLSLSHSSVFLRFFYHYSGYLCLLWDTHHLQPFILARSSKIFYIHFQTGPLKNWKIQKKTYGKRHCTAPPTQGWPSKLFLFYLQP